MLRWRLILGTVFIAALVGLFLLDVWAATDTTLPPGLILLPLALTITGAATREFTALVRTREPDFDGSFLSVGSWLIVASPWLGACSGSEKVITECHTLTVFAVIFFAFLMEMRRYDKNLSQRVTERLGLMVFGLVYIGLAMSFVVRLRLLSDGIVPLISMLVVVKMGDIGAYTVGRLFGKHKLAPRLSPGKTWEGLVGGLAFAVLGGVAYGHISGADVQSRLGIGPVVVWDTFVVYSLVVSTVGVVGDLAESLLKRDFGVKDSSTWMPGFGGVLDLIDSPLFAAPVAWAFWEFGWLVS